MFFAGIFKNYCSAVLLCVFLILVGYDSFAFGDHEDPLGCVRVEIIAGAVNELDVDHLDFLCYMLFFRDKLQNVKLIFE